MRCWYCYWGWARQVFDVYDAAVERLGDSRDILESGPSHIVWEDENFGDGSIESCLEFCDSQQDDYSQDELDVIRWSLEELRKIPIAIRCCEPADYDGEHPENFPPPAGIEFRTKEVRLKDK